MHHGGGWSRSASDDGALLVVAEDLSVEHAEHTTGFNFENSQVMTSNHLKFLPYSPSH